MEVHPDSWWSSSNVGKRIEYVRLTNSKPTTRLILIFSFLIFEAIHNS